MTSIKKVLLLTNGREPGWIEDGANSTSLGLHDFISELNIDGDIQFAYTTLDRIEFCIEDGDVSIYDTYTETELSDYDLVHFRNVSLYPDHARTISIYMAHHGKQSFEKVDVAIPDYGKLSQMVLFALGGVAVPSTWSAWGAFALQNLVEKKRITFPCILKANNGIKGHDNYLVKDFDQLSALLTERRDVQFVVQDMIPNDGDYRLLYFANAKPLLFKRIAARGSHLNNTSQGGTSEEIDVKDFDPVALDLAARAAQLTGRLLAGVDAIQDNKDKRWFILEVNANPALSSGVLLDRKIIGYKQMIKEQL